MRASRPNRPLNGVDCYVMENMDIDMVIDIPDTPDRVSRRSSLGREGNRRGSAAAAVGCQRELQLIDEEYCNYLSGKDRLVPGVGKTSKHRSESKKHCNIQTDNINDTHASRNTPLFRRATVEKDKGKSICTDFPVTSSASMQKNPGLNLNQFNGCARVLEMAAPKRLPLEGIRISSGLPLHGSRNSLKASDKNNKGKEKIDNSSGELACSASNRETNNLSSDPQCKKEDHAFSSSRPIVRASGHRRLVRNGCISPHVIAARAKQSVEYQTSSNGDINVRSGEDKTTSGDLSSIDIREIVAEDNIRNRIQGKRSIVHSHTSKDDGATSINGDSMRSRDAAGAEGWRSTRNRQKVGCSHPSSHPNVGHNIGRHCETNRRDEDDSQRSFRSRAEQHEINVVDQNANKRQRRIGFTSAVSDEQEVSIVGTSGEASSSRPARRQNQQRRGMHIPVLEIDDSSPEVRLNRRQSTRRVEDDESDVRVKQIEADERLARELQEQLYQEAQFFGDEEINEHMARMLQEEENSSRPSSRNPRRTNHNPSVGRGRSRLRTRFQPSSSSRRPNIPQPRASVRRTRSRGNRLGPPPATLRRALNLRFPSEMALESRLDILEEIETVIGQLGSSMNNGLLQLDRDFNEDDYEMLLALDDSNHNDQRGGTSANQINNLPQSTVQNDNFEETCAICLETPTTGDVIRHLPCLHKFHKDCIDPWLRRSKSCPVCKSSVT